MNATTSHLLTMLLAVLIGAWLVGKFPQINLIGRFTGT